MTEISPEAELRRIDFTGTIWFGASVLSAAIVGAVTFASGWRPGDQAVGDAGLWWVGSVLVAFAVAAFGWAGCPVLGFPIEQTDRQKRVCMRAGVATFVGGGILAMLALTLS